MMIWAKKITTFREKYLVLSYLKSTRAGGKKTQSAKKNTIFGKLSPTLTGTHRTHSWFTGHTLLVYILFPVRKNCKCNHTLQSMGSTPSFSVSVYEINGRRSTCVAGFHFSQKSMRSWSMYACVFVFNPNDENQCGRITKNIEKTRPGLESCKSRRRERLTLAADLAKLLDRQGDLIRWSKKFPSHASHTLKVTYRKNSENN